MKDLSYRAAISLPVAVGATTPVAMAGTEIWSTTANKLLCFDGDSWEPYAAPSGGDVVGPSSATAANSASFGDTSGKTIADSGAGKFGPEIIWTATSDLSSTLVNSVESLNTFTIGPGEKVLVKLCYAYRLSVTTMGAALGLWVANNAGNSISGSYQLMQCVNTSPATNVLSVGGAVSNSTALMFYQDASAVASSANANLGFLMDAILKNEHATNPLTVTQLIGTVGSGVTTVLTGSMAMLIRL